MTDTKKFAPTCDACGSTSAPYGRWELGEGDDPSAQKWRTYCAEHVFDDGDAAAVIDSQVVLEDTEKGWMVRAFGLAAGPFDEEDADRFANELKAGVATIGLRYAERSRRKLLDPGALREVCYCAMHPDPHVHLDEPV